MKQVILVEARKSGETVTDYSPPSVPVMADDSSSGFSSNLVKQPAQVKTVRPPTLRVLPPRIIAGCLQVPQSLVQLPATERLRGVAVC